MDKLKERIYELCGEVLGDDKLNEFVMEGMLGRELVPGETVLCSHNQSVTQPDQVRSGLEARGC